MEKLNKILESIKKQTDRYELVNDSKNDNVFIYIYADKTKFTKPTINNVSVEYDFPEVIVTETNEKYYPGVVEYDKEKEFFVMKINKAECKYTH